MGAPACTDAARVKENCFPLSFIAVPSCRTGPRASTGKFCRFSDGFAPSAAAKRPGNEREAARFRGKPGRRRQVPGTSPPPNRPEKQRGSVGQYVFVVRHWVHILARFVGAGSPAIRRGWSGRRVMTGTVWESEQSISTPRRSLADQVSAELALFPPTLRPSPRHRPNTGRKPAKLAQKGAICQVKASRAGVHLRRLGLNASTAPRTRPEAGSRNPARYFPPHPFDRPLGPFAGSARGPRPVVS